MAQSKARVEALTKTLIIRKNAHDKGETTEGLSRRIVLLGKSGVGKSAAGNTILGQEKFKSKRSMTSVTSVCSVERSIVSSRLVSVVDTPGFFDTKMNPEELAMEIARSVYISSPGPHAFLIVFPVNMRFTEQEQHIADQVELLFGEGVLKYSIILFTRGDQLKEKTVEELIEENCRLRHLVQQCGGRYHLFNNKDLNNREQVNDLLQRIDSMIQQNGGGHYTNQMYEDAQSFRQEEEEERQRRDEKILRELMRLREEVKRLSEEMMAQRVEEIRLLEEELQREERLRGEMETSRGFQGFFNKFKNSYIKKATVFIRETIDVIIGLGAAAAAAVVSTIKRL